MEAEFPRLLRTYVADAERALTEMNTGLARGEYDQVCNAAHHLKGASMNFGLAVLVEQLQRVEDLARAAKLAVCTHDPETSLAAALGAVQVQAHRAIGGLERLLQRMSAEASPR
jgi:HPt (histidine-containing phosphotransfer) domain-containing protein